MGGQYFCKKITGSKSLQLRRLQMSEFLSSVVCETPETKILNEMRSIQEVDSQMLNSLRVNIGVLQCRVKVQEFDGYGYPVSPVMWEWRDVEVLHANDEEGS
jgi:hypothetical protein